MPARDARGAPRSPSLVVVSAARGGPKLQQRQPSKLDARPHARATDAAAERLHDDVRGKIDFAAIVEPEPKKEPWWKRLWQ